MTRPGTRRAFETAIEAAIDAHSDLDDDVQAAVLIQHGNRLRTQPSRDGRGGDE